MSPKEIVVQVMEREFPGVAVEVVGPYLPDKGNDMRGSVLQIHVNIPEIQRSGSCSIDKREKEANEPASLEDLWKARAHMLADSMKPGRMADASHGRLVRDRTERPS